MSKVVLSSLFGLFNTIDWVGTLVAIFPLIGMLTSSVGLSSGKPVDAMVLLLLLSLPVCAIGSTVLFKFREKRVAGLLVSAIPAVIGAPLYLVAA